MKLINSVEELQGYYAFLQDNYMDVLVNKAKEVRSNPKVRDVDVAYRWAVWFGISNEVRDKIIAKSVPKETWVGGYPEVSSDHIDTLLKQVIDINHAEVVELC